MDQDKEMEFSIILFSLLSDFSELILFYSSLAKEEKEAAEKEELERQIQELSERVAQIEKQLSKLSG